MTAHAPGKSRHRSVLANLIATIVSQALAIGSQIVLVPVYLTAWGNDTYGDWLTVSALSGYFSLTDMGMQMYVVNRLTGHAVRGEEQEFRSTYHSALALYALLSGAALCILSGLAFLLPWDLWFAGRALNGPVVQVIVFVLGVSIVISVWAGFIGSMYRVFGEPERSTTLGLIQRALVLAVTFAMLAARRPPVDMALMQLVAPLVYLWWASRDVSRRTSLATPSLADASRRVSLSLLVPSGLFALLGVANGLTLQGSLLVASASLGPAAVTIFSTSRTLANVVKQGVSLIGYVAWPEFTRIDASGSSSSLATGHRLLVKIVSLCTAWIVCSLWFTGAFVHQRWTRGLAHFDQVLLQVLLAHALVMAPSGASGVLLAATNRHRALSLLYLLQGVVTILLCMVLVRVFGLPGIGLAILATDVLLFSLLIPKWSLEAVGESLTSFVAEIYFKLALIAGAAFASAWAVQQAALTPLTRLIITPGATFVPIFVGGLAWLRTDERALLSHGLERRKASGGGAAPSGTL